MHNILVTGADGQLGREMRTLGAASRHRYFFTDVADLDITDANTVRRFVENERIDAIVNCAAYTNVDKAEEEVETADRINREAVRNLAEAAKACDATLFHISTDYVFGGVGNTPFREEDPTAPLGMYGKTKLAGEEAIVASGCKHLVFRTAWLYLPHPPLPAGPHAAQTASQSRSTQRLQSRILRRTGTRRRDDPLRRTEQEIQHGHDLLPARPLRHRLRLGSRPGSDRRAVSGPQQPSRVQENRSNGCRNGFMTIQKRLDPFFEILLSLT